MVANWIEVTDLEDPEHADGALAVEAATRILWELSGRKYSGTRTITEVYAQYGQHELDRMDLPRPVLIDGEIRNVWGQGCAVCGCPHLIKLRGGPVIEIETVAHNDEPLELVDFQLYDYSWLGLKSTGMTCWGTCDELTVTYTYGAPPPAIGVLAARELANQFLWSIDDDEKCALPQRVTSISRQGVSWTLLDPQDFLEEGRTGIYLVDLFLKAVNPERARRRARVFSPDLPRGKTRR